MTIRIGPRSEIYEEKILKRLGSIHLTKPLMIPHSRGEPVEAISEGPYGSAVHHEIGSRGSKDESDEDSSKEASSSSSNDSSGTKKKKKKDGKDNKNVTYKTIVAPPVPLYRSKARQFHLKLTEAAVRASGRKDFRDKHYLDEVTSMTVDDPDLDDVPIDYVRLDRALLPALEKIIKGHT